MQHAAYPDAGHPADVLLEASNDLDAVAAVIESYQHAPVSERLLCITAALRLLEHDLQEEWETELDTRPFDAFRVS